MIYDQLTRAVQLRPGTPDREAALLTTRGRLRAAHSNVSRGAGDLFSVSQACHECLGFKVPAEPQAATPCSLRVPLGRRWGVCTPLVAEDLAEASRAQAPSTGTNPGSGTSHTPPLWNRSQAAGPRARLGARDGSLKRRSVFVLRRRGRGGRSGESRGVCGVGSLGAGLRRGAAERSQGSRPRVSPLLLASGNGREVDAPFPRMRSEKRHEADVLAAWNRAAPARPPGASSCSRCSPRRPCRRRESLEWVLPRRPLTRTEAGRLEDAGPCGRRAAARASEPLSAQQATGPHTELRVAGRAPRPRSLPQLQRIREHVQPPGKGAEKEPSGASRSALASASGATGIPRLLRWTGTVPADVSRRRVTGHGQSTASTQPLRITA